MNYGYFDDGNGEYVITRPDTPKPWSNYMGSADFGALVSNNASGYTFYKSAAQGRLSRFRFNSIPADMPGKYIYLRDNVSGEFWSNSWLPVQKKTEEFKYSCRFGAGYSVINYEFSGIACETSYFIPLGRLFEIWRVKLSNNSGRKRILDVFPFIEPQCNWNALDDTTNLQYTHYIAKTQFVDGMMDIGSNVNMPEDLPNFTNKDQNRHTFMALSGDMEVVGHDGELERFIGAYGSYSAPEAVVRGSCRGSAASGGNPCAALQGRIALEPGHAADFAVFFGVGAAKETGNAIVREFDSAEKTASALEEVKQHWHSRVGNLKAETPDPLFNSMMNMWAPFNNLMTFYWSRTASMVYAGERDGLGFRDTVQDIVGAASLVAEEAGARLELMLTGQLANGGALPVVSPFSHQPGGEKEPSHYRCDDCLWFFNAVPEYVKETGDFGFYSKILPYADKGEDSVFGHLRRAIEFSLERSGAHGLPCGLHADWNDCIRLGEKGESVFAAFQLRLAFAEYIEIAHRLNAKEDAAWAVKKLGELDQNLETHAWDGEWYLRAYRDDGLKFGSRENEEGKIFMNPQAWAVLSGHATGDKAKKCLDSMDKHLFTEYGIMLCTPPYVNTDPKVCLGRLMNPGMKENGGIFNHTQGWAVMAAAKIGDPGRAWRYMKAVMPASFNDKAEIRKLEPFVVCQSTHSKFSPHFGMGGVSWLSGSAVWNYYAMSNAILGIKPHYDGLQIRPAIPADWDGYKAVRKFRGCEFRFSVRRGDEKGLAHNGKQLAADIIPAADFAAMNNVDLLV